MGIGIKRRIGDKGMDEIEEGGRLRMEFELMMTETSAWGEDWGRRD
jgi:hypothetical protein